MITPGLVWALGASQLVLWGVTYYMAAIFGDAIAAEMGWSRTVAFGGFSVALVVMGLSSRRVGRAIDRRGGRLVMGWGSVLAAAGCAGLALTRDMPTYFAAWTVLGLAMRMTLYDAAFASLARIGGPEARRPISQITLLGGLASTVVWPIGQALVQTFGWRSAMACYAALALATLPLHLMIPPERWQKRDAGLVQPPAPLADTPRKQLRAGFLYATTVTLTSFLNSAMSAHMIAIMSGLGLSVALAVWISTLRGVGQSASRLAEILFGRRLDPLALGILATGLLPIGFALGLASGTSTAAAVAFALLYGAGNGLVTIIRGTQPLILFDHASYGTIVGRLIGPSFYLSALAPIAFAALIERFGSGSALLASELIAIAVFASSLALWLLFRQTGNARP